MANEENLIPLNRRSKSEQREIQRKGGIANGEARREKKLLRDALIEALALTYQGKNGVSMTGTEAMAAKAVDGALRGDWKAWELVRDTTGQKPTDKSETSITGGISMLTESDRALLEKAEALFADRGNTDAGA